MALYTIYAYQFKPLAVQLDLFNKERCLEQRSELMSQKNKIFENIIKSCIFTHRNRELSSQLLFCSDEIIAFKLANVKAVHLEQKFQIKTTTDEPSATVLIYNDANVQRIAIEQNKAFTDTGVVIRILKKAFNDQLENEGLSITIKKEYQASEAAVSAKTRLEFNSAEKECLNIDESNEQIKGLTQAASGSGNSVVLRIKGMKKLQKTGYTTKTLRFDDLEIQANNVEDIKEIFRSLDE